MRHAKSPGLSASPLPGSKNAARTKGVPRNLGRARCSGAVPERPQREQTSLVGHRAVGALHRSDDAGEPNRGTPPSKEQRRGAEPSEGTMNETQGSVDISTKLERIAKLAKDKPGVALTTLAHNIDMVW